MDLCKDLLDGWMMLDLHPLDLLPVGECPIICTPLYNTFYCLYLVC